MIARFDLLKAPTVEGDSSTGGKHLQDAAARSQTATTPLNMQLLGESYTKAVNAAMQAGVKFGEKMNVGGWELIFEKARDGGSPVLIHALQK